jgi:hypothetical protein
MENPAGHLGNIWVAAAGKKIVTYYAMNPVVINYGGRKLLGAMPLAFRKKMDYS